MAQGIRAGIEGVSLVGGNIAGNDVAREGDAWTAAKCILPMLSLKAVSIALDLSSHLPIIEAECCFCLTCGDVTADLDYVFIYSASHEIQIRKDKGLVRVEANSNNVLCIFPSEPLDVFHSQAWFMKVFFVVGQLDHEGHIEDFVEPPKGLALIAVMVVTYRVNPNGTI
jgi:hypothetical protein